DPPTTWRSPLPLHDALPISVRKGSGPRRGLLAAGEAGDAGDVGGGLAQPAIRLEGVASEAVVAILLEIDAQRGAARPGAGQAVRSEEHTSELQSRENLVCRP